MSVKNTGSVNHVRVDFFGFGKPKLFAQRLFTLGQRLWGLDRLVNSIVYRWEVKNSKELTRLATIDFYAKGGEIPCSDAISAAMRAKGIPQIIIFTEGSPYKSKIFDLSLKYLFRWLAANGIPKKQGQLNFRLKYICENVEKSSYMAMAEHTVSAENIAEVTIQFVNADYIMNIPKDYPYRGNLNSSDKVAMITLKFSYKDQ